VKSHSGTYVELGGCMCIPAFSGSGMWGSSDADL
jgi:hypothetical protein